MERGFPVARLGAALSVSLAGHFGLAWYAGGLLGPLGSEPGRRPAPIQARLADVPGVALQAEPPAPPKSKAGSTQAVPHLPGRPPYTPAAELDVRPQIMTHVMPQYPENVLSGTRGRVVLELFIGVDGLLDHLRVAHAEPREMFEQAALEAFSAARFTPGRKNRQSVPSVILIEVTFSD